MTPQGELGQMLAVSRVIYDRQSQALLLIQQEETALRNDLARLENANRTVAAATDDLNEMRSIGADILWQGWLGRAKVRLNMELAKVLARKAHEQDQLRRAFGRVAALEELITNAKEHGRKGAAEKELAKVIEMSLRSPSFGNKM